MTDSMIALQSFTWSCLKSPNLSSAWWILKVIGAMEWSVSGLWSQVTVWSIRQSVRTIKILLIIIIVIIIIIYHTPILRVVKNTRITLFICSHCFWVCCHSWRSMYTVVTDMYWSHCYIKTPYSILMVMPQDQPERFENSWGSIPRDPLVASTEVLRNAVCQYWPWIMTTSALLLQSHD